MNDSRRRALLKSAVGVLSVTGIGCAAAKQYKKSQGKDWKKSEDEGTTDESSDTDIVEEEQTDFVTGDNPDGPAGEWSLRLDEQWNEFDTSRWGVGFIDHEDWIPDDDASVSPEHVVVEDNQCRLLIESTGTGPDGCYQGVINSSTGGEGWHPSEGVPIDPAAGEGGQYMEARIKMPGRTGILPGFWGHAANMNWPPEIDVVELFQYGDNPSRERQTLHTNAHWTSSTEPGDMDTHLHNGNATETGIDLTETFNTYGCAWFEDRIEWYFNGEHVITRDSPDELLETLNHEDARPFGLIFSNHVNRIGEADLYDPWTEEMVIDWVRVWDFDGESDENSSEETNETDESDEWIILDNFDGGEFGEWYTTGAWGVSSDVASSGSHSAVTNIPWSVLTWDGQPAFERGTTLQFDFAFDHSDTQQLNCRFGDASRVVGDCYRLDIHRDQIALLDTAGWGWLGGDGTYANGTALELYTAEIKFSEEEIRIRVDGETDGTITVADSSYDGGVLHFDIDTGGVYIDEVRVRTP
ncbi:family 16 glycosylhydrolase [Haloterrigena salinisoli]|uniref:glycoside hydrolase family 16 protein n=1 Tax=Haloterrigena salinisoli TaxID=3132747 RepID=UPI0030CE5D74